MTFEEVWEKLKAEDTTGTFAMAEKLSLVSVEAIEYAFNSGYAEGLKAQRPQGEWERVADDKVHLEFIYKCSECGRRVSVYNTGELANMYPFCHCGADMRGEEQ